MTEIRKIASFTVDHDVLREGIYVSRVDGDVTTYDLRTRVPNAGDYMDNVTMHTTEHMIATYIRSSAIGDRVIYFGPMGCRTGFYLLVRNADNDEVLSVLCDTLEKVIAHEGRVFGDTPTECGNYRELDLDAAKRECARYLAVLRAKTNDFRYPTKDTAKEKEKTI